ncbi:MAG: putative zinc-binding metallopeptidase [Saprospiraceae bacterium]|nr:putative zinc-binding metallopeptidase [Saprospiraceae bacterium]
MRGIQYIENKCENSYQAYRTLLGHFRHEIGHYYWMLLSDHNDKVRFREIFGDENVNYTEAIQSHYTHDAPQDWNQRFISKYASSHPWEDWAETWAHYLHIMDTLETAHYLGLSLESHSQASFMNLERVRNPYTTSTFRKIIEDSVALTCAGNSLNRSMGLPDIYPFVWSNSIYTKLEFIHEFVKSHQHQERKGLIYKKSDSGGPTCI